LARCGDGITGAGEDCDDGNSVDDDCCTNSCASNTTSVNCDSCGNGMEDDGEECDEGGDTATCDGDCTLPSCGDGYVNPAAGEQCEASELQGCDSNCKQPTTSSAGGTDPCNGQATFKGYVNDSMSPLNTGGPGIVSVWSYGGEIGVMAGTGMCQAIGADHVCTYKEVQEAAAKGELSSLPDGQRFWLHRVTESVPKVGDPNQMSVPGPGGRCNDWTYPTDHISDGEYGIIGTYPTDPDSGENAGGGVTQDGVTYYFDDDTAFTGLGGPAGSGPGAGGVCGAGNSARRRWLLCCFATCTN
jgi:hypothetical protein